MAHILAVQQQQLRVAGRDVQHRVELNLKVQATEKTSSVFKKENCRQVPILGPRPLEL